MVSNIFIFYQELSGRIFKGAEILFILLEASCPRVAGISIRGAICFLYIFTERSLHFCLICHAYFFAHDLYGSEENN